MQIKALFLVAMIVAGAVSSPAHACRLSANQTPILHDKIPALGPDLIAVEVEITTDVRSTPSPPLEARIISMIRGKYAGSLLRIEPQGISSCDGFPYPGQRGIVVGRVVKSSDGVLVIDPIRAPSANQIREDKAALSNKPTS